MPRRPTTLAVGLAAVVLALAGLPDVARGLVLPEGLRLSQPPTWCSADPSEPTGACQPRGPLPQKGWPSEWPGRGEVTFRIEARPSLEDVSLGLSLLHLGAAEVRVDGRQVARFGALGTDEEDERAARARTLVPIVFLADDGPVHAIDVSYSSFVLRDPRWAEWEPVVDLGLRVTTPDSPGLALAPTPPRDSVLLGLMLAFGAVHLSLFVFEPRERTNLSFGILSLCCAAGLALMPRLQDWTTFDELFLTLVGFRASLVLLTLSFVAFVHRFTEHPRPRVFRGLVVLGILVVAGTWWRPLATGQAALVYTLLSIPETLWCFERAQRNRTTSEPTWWIHLGAVPLLLTGLAQIFVLFGALERAPKPLGDPFFAIAFLMLAMSLFLARRFARTGRELEGRLVEVEDLSARTLRQEVERVRLEADNTRKTRELEEARQLQLSMLPDAPPRSERWRVAASMRTAAEVGGDYYDFRREPDGGLTTVVGDATGHGVQAGTLVAATKALFSADENGTPARWLAEANRAIHAMRLRRRRMSLVVLRLNARRLSVASAGMPPVWIRRADGTTEEVEATGLPLGSLPDVVYDEITVELAPGDLVVAMSDGLPERQNAEGEMLGYSRLAAAIGGLPADPEAALRRLEDLGRRWSDRDLDDDATLVTLVVDDCGARGSGPEDGP